VLREGQRLGLLKKVLKKQDEWGNGNNYIIRSFIISLNLTLMGC
jgi:hypothetical protein